MSTQPQVVVNVAGGIAEAIVTVGDIDVVLIDWDNYEDFGLLDHTPEDLAITRRELERIVDPELRDRLLADLDRVAADLEDALS